MIRKSLFIFISFLMLSVSVIAWAQSDAGKQNLVKKSEPIEIVSDRMEAFQTKKMVIFSGHAVATQADLKLKTDQLLIYYKDKKGKTGKTEKTDKKDIDTEGELERIEARGNVVVTQKTMTATGKEGVYYKDVEEIVLTGSPVLQDGNNIIKGCKVIVYLNEGRGKVEPCIAENSGRVTAIIHPKGDDKKNKP